MAASAKRAVRARIHGTVAAVGFRAATVRRAGELELLGWVRSAEDGTALVHAEGDAAAVDELLGYLGKGPPDASVESVEVEEVKPEGHEQFAVRGVPAGRYSVELGGPDGPYFLRLEVDGSMRSWLLPKAPSMDPATKRMAVELGEASPDAGEPGGWDAGTYEQGGRVPWPEALVRGHAVFVLHGERLDGGFALQRTRGGARPQWLLIKRRE
jgi:acylphosphatase